MSKPKKIHLIAITPVFLLLSHYLAVFPHEYAHSFMAWVLGYKANPLDLEYGGYSLANLLLLINIDENVNYTSILALGHYYSVAIIAFAGPGLANGILYLISKRLLLSRKIQSFWWVFYFLFYFNLMNLGNLFDYIPVRVFAIKGDIAHIIKSLNVSAWVVYIVGTYLVGYLIWNFYKVTLPLAYNCLGLRSVYSKTAILFISTVILFGYFSLPGLLMGHSSIPFFISVNALLLIPVIMIIARPKQKIE